MNQATATLMAQGFLKGTFDVVDAMLGVTSSYHEPEIRPGTPAELTKLTETYAFVTHAKIKTGGAVALLLTVQDAARLASLVLSGTALAKDVLDDGDISSLKEIVDPCMGGGVSNLQEKFGVEVELTDLQVSSGSAVDLMSRFGGAFTAAVFAYSVPPDIDGHGAILLADSLERLVPGASAAPQPAAGGPASGLPSSQETTMTMSPNSESRPVEPLPANMDMILDIRLMATARLGRIEMPISDILALGPGSIFEVGRAVDDPIDLLINDKLIARGDVVVVDEKFGIRITEIVSTRERIESLR